MFRHRTPPVAALPAALAIAAIASLASLAVLTPSASAATAPNPCLDPVKQARLWCPDLVMKRPSGLRVDRKARRGRVVLRAGNSIDNIGLGPAELHGVRSSRLLMRARQRIHRRAGGRLGIATGARLFFKFVPRQRNYWKFLDAAKFELFGVDPAGLRTTRVRRGPKVSYCLRDLRHSRPGRPRSPRRFRYPACNSSFDRLRVTLGTSVGWSDVYPATYHEQWIDVTGLRGCFDYIHTADPRNGIYESNEDNNASFVRVRLPYRPGAQLCPGEPAPVPPPPPQEPPQSGY